MVTVSALLTGQSYSTPIPPPEEQFGGPAFRFVGFPGGGQGANNENVIFVDAGPNPQPPVP